MKIGPLDPKPVATPVSGERKAGPNKLGGKTEASAKVEISPEASQLASTAADPTFDASKVDRIASAIRDGSFKVDAEKIADKLIANAQDLLKRYSQN